jgi:hypothetical protein
MKSVAALRMELKQKGKELPLKVLSERKVLLKTVMGDVPVIAEMSPCSWMYKPHFAQFGFKLPTGSEAFIKDTSKDLYKFGESDFKKMVKQVTKWIRPCKKCKTQPAFTGGTNRKGLCEACFLKALDAEYAPAIAKEEAKLAKRDAREKAKGFKYRTTIWIHAGGDDYMVDSYTVRKMTKAEIRNACKKRGSKVFNDYSVIKL